MRAGRRCWSGRCGKALSTEHTEYTETNMWRVPTENDLETVLTGPEIAAVKTAALEVGSGNPVPATLENVVDEVRGYIAGCSRNRLGAAGTLPTQLIAVAMTVVRERLLNRFPQLGLLSAERQTEYANAMIALRDVAKCQIAVEAPPGADVGPEILPSPVPKIYPRRLHRQPCDADGI